MIVNLDFETRSCADLRSCGVYRYVEDPTTDIWCMAFAFEGEDEVYSWEPLTTQGVHIDRLVNHIQAGCELHAWNAQFERVVWRIMAERYGWPVPDLDQWHCTMARAANYGLPLKLDTAAKALGVQNKDEEGAALMMRMTRPRSMKGGRPVWWDVRDRIDRLVEYCKQDVRVERDIAAKLDPMPPRERKLWLLDQRINDRGIGLDVPLVRAAKVCSERAQEDAAHSLAAITKGEVNSVTDVIGITQFVNSRGVVCNSIAKAAVTEMLERKDLPTDVRECLQVRQDAAKSSVKKLEAMLACVSAEQRVRGLLAYHGASTGRWAGRLVQPHNFPKGTVKQVEDFLPYILTGDLDFISLIDAPLEVLSAALRSLFVASPGRKLLSGDYASIEARVLAWLAGEERMLALYHAKQDVYKDMASSIYRIPTAQVSSTQRNIGKAAVLGLGFQMGATRFQAQTQTNAGVYLPFEFCKEVVAAYRTANTRIVRLWGAVERAAIRATQTPGHRVTLPCGVSFVRKDDWLFCYLPSGRRLAYLSPRVVPREMPWKDDEGKPVYRDGLQSMGQNSVTRQWEEQRLYGGLLVENIVQGVARDIMADAMLRLDDEGYNLVLTVHDEVVAEDDPARFEEFLRLLAIAPDWAAGCPIAVEGWCERRYRK